MNEYTIENIRETLCEILLIIAKCETAREAQKFQHLSSTLFSKLPFQILQLLVKELNGNNLCKFIIHKKNSTDKYDRDWYALEHYDEEIIDFATASKRINVDAAQKTDTKDSKSNPIHNDKDPETFHEALNQHTQHIKELNTTNAGGVEIDPNDIVIILQTSSRLLSEYLKREGNLFVTPKEERYGSLQSLLEEDSDENTNEDSEENSDSDDSNIQDARSEVTSDLDNSQTEEQAVEQTTDEEIFKHQIDIESLLQYSKSLFHPKSADQSNRRQLLESDIKILAEISHLDPNAYNNFLQLYANPEDNTSLKQKFGKFTGSQVLEEEAVTVHISPRRQY